MKLAVFSWKGATVSVSGEPKGVYKRYGGDARGGKEMDGRMMLVLVGRRDGRLHTYAHARKGNRHKGLG